MVGVLCRYCGRETEHKRAVCYACGLKASKRAYKEFISRNVIMSTRERRNMKRKRREQRAERETNQAATSEVRTSE